MKTWPLLLVAPALAGLLWIVSRPGEPDATSSPDPSRGSFFEVWIEKPRSGRPLFGILPKKLEAKLAGHSDLRFADTDPGAMIGVVEPDRLELAADGWELVIETDDQGRITPETHLVFSLLLAEKQQTLRCRPADLPLGALHTLPLGPRDGPETLSGRFVVELEHCTNVETGNAIGWPPSALTVRGVFEGLPVNAMGD